MDIPIVPNKDTSIMRLPNELLHQTFSYLPPIRVTSLFFPHLRGTHSTLLALRHTCHRFRAIVADPIFWCTDDGDGADWSELVSTTDSNLTSAVREECFLKALLADPQIMESLESKNMWSFSYHQGLLAVLQFVPLFRQNADFVILYGIGYPVPMPFLNEKPMFSIHDIIKTLTFCRCIHTLHIQLVKKIDLEIIVKSCTSLRDLRFTNVGYYEPVDERLHLQRLDIYNEELESSDRIFPIHLVVPEDLVDLRLCIDDEFDDSSVSYGQLITTFIPFVNLTVLWISPLYDDVCDLIIASHLNLIDFGIVVFPYSLAHGKLIKLFQSEALRNIQVLNLLVDDMYSSDFEATLDAITSLSDLREIEIAMGLHTSWCQKFSRLKKLQSLDWITSSDSYCDLPTCNGVLHTPCQDVYDATDERPYHLGNLDDETIGERMFHEAFEGFKEKPHIIFEVLDQYEYNDVCMRLYRMPH
jgi:hypothetical protein